MRYSFIRRSYVRGRRARALRLTAALLPSLVLAVSTGCDHDPADAARDGRLTATPTIARETPQSRPDVQRSIPLPAPPAERGDPPSGGRVHPDEATK